MAYPPNSFDYSQLPSAFPGLDPNAMEAATQAYQAWFKTIVAINKETSSFIAHRLQQDAQLSGNLMQCRTPMDLAQVQMNFCRDIVADYTRQTERMSSVVKESFQSVDRPETLSWTPDVTPVFPAQRRAA